MDSTLPSPIGDDGYQRISNILIFLFTDIRDREAIIKTLNERAEKIKPLIPTAEELGEQTRFSSENKVFISTSTHKRTAFEDQMLNELKGVNALIQVTVDNGRMIAEKQLDEVLVEMKHFYRGRIPMRVPKDTTSEQHFVSHLHVDDQLFYVTVRDGLDSIRKAQILPEPTMKAINTVIGSIVACVTPEAGGDETQQIGAGASRTGLKKLLSVHLLSAGDSSQVSERTHND